MSRRGKTFAASYQADVWKGKPGLLHVYDDGTFEWRPKQSVTEAQMRGLPSGLLSSIHKAIASKVGPNKPAFLKVDLTENNISYLFLFESESERQNAKDALLKSNTSSTSTARPVSTPSPTNTPSTSPVGPRISMAGVETGDLEFNAPKLLSNEELQARASLLAKDPELRKRHEELVNSKLLSETDFWIGKEARVEEERVQLRLKTGLVPEALIDPMRSDTAITGSTTKEVEMSITKEMIERVFLEHPEVRKKYKELVPDKVSEKQFWTAYMHGKYVLGAKRNVDFHELTKSKGVTATVKKSRETVELEQKAEELFGEVDEYRLQYREDLQRKLKTNLSRVDPWVNLKSTLDDSITVPVITGLANDSGYGLIHRDTTDIVVASSEKEFARSLRAKSKLVDKDTSKKIREAVKDDPVLTKINQRGTLALHTTEVEADDQMTEEERRKRALESEQLRRARLEEDHTADLKLDMDLLPAPPLPVAELKLSRGDETSSKRSPARSMPSTSKTAAPVQAIAIRPSAALPNPQTVFATAAITEEEAQLAKLDPRLRDVHENIREPYLLALTAVDEYCRHFWTTNDAGKRCLIVRKMREMQKKIDQDLRLQTRDWAPSALPLLRAPLAQLGCCFAEHDKTCSKRHDE